MSIEKKLTYLNETKNQIKSALNTPYNVFRDYPALISKYVKNQPKSIVEGSTAICENAVDLPCNIDVNGNSYQETTEGYQLVDLSNLQETTQFGATVKPNGDGSFTINGTTSNSFGFNVPCTPRNLKANTTYKIKTIVKSGSASSTANSQIALREEADANLINCKLAGESKTYTPTEDKTINYVRIYLDKEVTFTNLVIQAMFYEGTDDKPYEPYTGGQASPNTEYKQDIEVITECSLVQRGKNLINVPEFTITGGTIAYQGKSLVFPQVKKAGTYTLQRKFEIISGLENQVSGTGLAQIYIGTKWLKNINKTEDSATFNIDHDLSSAEQFKITFLVSGSVTSESDITIKYHEIQLEEGDKATSYEPYIEPIVHSIDLQGNSLAKVGEIADLLNIGVDGRVSIGNKKIGVHICTGNENIIKSSSTICDRYIMSLSNITNVAESYNLMSNYFKVAMAKINHIWQSEKRIVFEYAEYGTSTLDEFKAFLKQKYDENKPVIILYELATSETIPLPSISPIKLIEGITNIFELITNLGTTMKVEYIVDVATLQNEITELSNAVIELGGVL